MNNIFTVDFEDWFSPRHFPGFSALNWEDCKLFINEPTQYLLKLLKRKNIKAVFFILGYIADKVPQLVKQISDEGHEIASHGYSHQLINKMSQEDFKIDIEKSLESLAKIKIFNVRGYRAPSFSITEKTLWAVDILKEYGFTYSSSVYPTNLHPDYGMKNINQKIFEYDNGLIEIPMNTALIFNYKIPCSGGAYLRFANYPIFKKLVQVSKKQTQYYMFYIHPWELAEDQPKISTSFLHSFRHYYNIKSVKNKIEKLTDDFIFSGTIDKVIYE